MNNPNKTQAMRMIKKFDKQLRDLLTEELKSVRAQLRSGNAGFLVS